MATSIIRELQRDALDPDVRVADLLRKALVVARKLRLKEFETWISDELNGYQSRADVPAYREITGHVVAWNPANGWIPIRFESARDAKAYSTRKTNQAIAAIEAMAGKEDGTLCMPFPPEVENRILTESFLSNLSLQISASPLHGILDAVRNIVLNWTLKLEEDGVVGTDFSFTNEEREAASGSTYHNVNNFYGSVGNAQVAQASESVSQVQEIKELNLDDVRAFVAFASDTLPKLKLHPDQHSEIQADLETVKSQATSSRPKTQIIRESLGSVRRILESAGGSVAGALLRQMAGLP